MCGDSFSTRGGYFTAGIGTPRNTLCKMDPPPVPSKIFPVMTLHLYDL